MPAFLKFFLVMLVLSMTLALTLFWFPAENRAAEPASVANFLGSAACAGCHAAEHSAWQRSQHSRAMQHATGDSVRGDFDDARFTYAGFTSTFFRNDGRFFVRTDGPDGQLADFEVKYTFGVEPLQQYLIELPGGRLQALSISWDSRPRSAGGQRWFHLYPDERIDHRDELHWTQPAQNWNSMCADCHSTAVRRGYDAGGDRFDTRWSEIAVGCEACHGPGSRHAAAPTAPYRRVVDGVDAAEMSACAACHARRAQFAEGALAGDALLEHYLPAVLGESLYYADGQQQGEVFIWGSYLQSRKHAAGVTCGACHEPHTQKLRHRGDAVCTQCHAAATFAVPQHHHHATGSAAAACVSCHMRQTTYMVIDPRRDHGFHVPRPDLAQQLGVPNACADCHAERSAAWASAALQRWFGAPRSRPKDFAAALQAGRAGEAGAVAQLLTLLEDPAQPALVRATAIELLTRYPGEGVERALRRSLSDADPLVRLQALRAQQGVEALQLSTLVAPMLADPLRAIRHEAARQLALARAPVAAPDQARYATELAAYERTLQFDLSRAAAWVNLGNWQAARGDPLAAENSLRAAIRREPGYAPAWVNLADLLRMAGREGELEALLREALRREAPQREALPGVARARAEARVALREALGLSLVRQGRKAEALREFARSFDEAPRAPRVRYVYALALHDAGRAAQAIRLLQDGLADDYDRDSLLALAAWQRAAGREAESRQALQRLRAVNPGDPALAHLSP